MARRADLPLSTAHRLVAELTAWGALEREPDGNYHVGLRLWEVATLAPRGVGLREAALPFMEDLYEATHGNVQLAVRDGLDTVYVERLAGRLSIGVRTRVGLRFPLHAPGVGLVLLAYAPESVQDAVLAAPLASFTPQTVTDPAELRRRLADVRRSGIAVSDRQVTSDAISVAAPLFGAVPGQEGTGEVVAALSVVLPADGTAPWALAPAVRAAALGISRVLRDPVSRAPVGMSTSTDQARQHLSGRQSTGVDPDR